VTSDARFEGRRAAVTGAGGFIGNATARRLADEGAAVVGIDANPAAADRVRGAGAEFVAADVTDRAAVEQALEGVELLVHTAAYVHEWGEMEEFRVNVGGTATVLDAAEEAGVGRTVHLSSVVVYGYEDAGEQDEDSVRRVCGIPYIDTKSASDRLACRRGAIVIRPGDVYGPGGTQWVLRPLELAKARRLAAPGDGDGLMLPVYVTTWSRRSCSRSSAGNRGARTRRGRAFRSALTNTSGRSREWPAAARCSGCHAR
jgi:nucleoside-diphosphate-sugar epimerase